MRRIDITEAVFTIRVAAQETGLHPQTIRVYEQKGLIKPARSAGGTRMYSIRDIEILEEIQEMSSSGVGIEGISRILSLEQTISELEETLDELRKENEDLKNK